jgi:cytochrome c oxidase cbb3-type subunit 3
MKKVFSLLGLIAFSNSAFAQETGATQTSLTGDPYFPLYLLSAFVFAVVLVVLIVAIYFLRILNILTQEAEKENAVKLGVAYAPKKTWWANFIDQLNAAVPIEKEKEIELNHNYDGIKELDNHLPPWWTGLFVGSIIWGVIYLIVYHVSETLPLQLDEYEQEVTLANEQIRKLKASQPQEIIDESNLVFTNDLELIEKGKAAFLANTCATCHRPDGGGNAIGPNLTDEYWIHGGSIQNIFETIKNGVVEKGMPAWGKSMSAKDVKAAAFYIMSLQGSKPVDAKAPQGELYKQEVVKSDSTKAQASL